MTESFDDLYRTHAKRVLVFFVRRTFDVEVARDLMAETFAQAFEHRRRFRGGSEAELGAWLFGIARHQLSRYARRGRVHRAAVERLGIELPAISEDDHDRIVELASLTEMRERVLAGFALLSDDERRALQLRIVDERPYPDVAASLGVSEGTARARVSRALRKLADALDLNARSEVRP